MQMLTIGKTDPRYDEPCKPDPQYTEVELNDEYCDLWELKDMNSLFVDFILFEHDADLQEHAKLYFQGVSVFSNGERFYIEAAIFHNKDIFSACELAIRGLFLPF